MAHPNRLQEIASERGQTVHELVNEIVVAANGNLAEAARSIRVSRWTVKRWLKNNELAVHVSGVKPIGTDSHTRLRAN